MSEILHRLPEFAANHLFLVMILVVLLVSLVGNEMSRLFRGYRELTPAALTRLINRESPLLFDFSAAPEFDSCRLRLTSKVDRAAARWRRRESSAR